MKGTFYSHTLKLNNTFKNSKRFLNNSLQIVTPCLCVRYPHQLLRILFLNPPAKIFMDASKSACFSTYSSDKPILCRQVSNLCSYIRIYKF